MGFFEDLVSGIGNRISANATPKQDILTNKAKAQLNDPNEIQQNPDGSIKIVGVSNGRGVVTPYNSPSNTPIGPSIPIQTSSLPTKIAQQLTSVSPQVQQPATQSPTPPTSVTTQAQSGYQQGQNASFGRNPGNNPKNISSSVQNAINSAADYYKVPRSLMYDMASAESTFNPNNVNNTPDGVKAGYPTGLYQFTTKPGFDNEGKPMEATWQTVLNYGNNPASTLHLPNGGKNAADPVDNAYAAAYMISHGQLGRWDASDGNWGKFYTPKELEDQGFYKEDTTHTPGKFYYQLSKK